MDITVHIRHTRDDDLALITAIHQAAFPNEAVDALAVALLADPSARPCLSLLAEVDGMAVGHVLFSAAALEPGIPQTASLLAPLAVLPAYQGRGIGSRLVEDGLARLKAAGVDLVFVLGHPDYYPRFGFLPAGMRGFAAPYPIKAKYAEAWMVLCLDDAPPEDYAGKVCCARALDRPEYWRE